MAVANNGKPIRRKPLPTDSCFEDFNLQSLNLQSPDFAQTTWLSAPSTQFPSRDSDAKEKPLPTLQGWTPFYLKRTVLLGFIALFICLFIILAVLYGYSRSHQGLSTANEQLYYFWTYGPTAVLSVIAALWIQVVYRTKQLMPWKAMAVAPQPASRSILLDYISPIDPVALFKAVSNAHHVVTLSIISAFVFMGLTIFSTGLFNLQHVDIVARNVSLLATNDFDLSQFDWSSTDARPTALVYAISQLGQDYPSGTTAQYAIQNVIDPHGKYSNMTLSSVANVFSAHLDCEPATLQVTNISEYAPTGHLFHSGITFTVNMTSPSCTVTNFDVNSGTFLDSTGPYNETTTLPWGYGQFANCLERDTYRVLATVGYYVIHAQWNGTELSDYPVGLTSPWNKMGRIINSTNLLCVPRYDIEEARIVKKMNSTSLSNFTSIQPLGSARSQADQGAAVDIARGVFQSINDPFAQAFYSNDSLMTISSDTFFNLLQQQGPSLNNIDAALRFWHQHNNLARESSALYQSIATQLAALKLLKPANDSINGEVTVNKPRLLVRTLSFGLMEAGFIMLVAVGIYLLFSATEPLMAHDPGSIIGLATILSKSPEMVSQFNGTGANRKAQLDEIPHEHAYSTSLTRESVSSYVTKICMSGSGKPKSTLSERRTSLTSIRWWQPLILRRLSRILIVILTLSYIVVLELLFAFSQSHQGLLAIDTNSWLHYGWTYIPALLMVVIGLAYSSANSSVKIISPYSAMHNRSVPASISVQDHPLSRTALHELFVSARKRQLAVFATTFAALLTPLLTIAVSGLYAPKNHIQSTEVHQLTGWNFNGARYPNSTILNNTFVSINQSNPTEVADSSIVQTLTDLVVTANLSYPSWTYGELALPVFQVKTLGKERSQNSFQHSGSVDMTIPAVRGALNCSIVPPEAVDMTYATYNTSTLSDINIETAGWRQTGNRQCLNYSVIPGMSQWIATGTTGCRIALISLRNGSSLSGCSLRDEAVFLPRYGAASQTFGYFSATQSLTNYSYCPAYVGMVGTTTHTEIEDYTWFACSTSVERVDARTTFTLPDYTISSAYADESTAAMVAGNASNIAVYNNTGDANWISFQGPNAALSGNGGTAIEANSYLTFINVTGGENYDNFFSALVYGREGVPASELLGAANTPRLFAAVQHLWRVVYAQQFRTSYFFMSAMPEDIKAWAPQGPWNATLMDPNAYRLKQSKISTRILQGILGMLAICAIVAFVSMDTRRVLPNNPSSIAVVASLLAGSELLDVVGRMEEREGEKGEEGREEDWRGYFFSLGWWGRPDGTRRFGIDIGKADPAG